MEKEPRPRQAVEKEPRPRQAGSQCGERTQATAGRPGRCRWKHDAIGSQRREQAPAYHQSPTCRKAVSLRSPTRCGWAGRECSSRLLRSLPRSATQSSCTRHSCCETASPLADDDASCGEEGSEHSLLLQDEGREEVARCQWYVFVMLGCLSCEATTASAMALFQAHFVKAASWLSSGSRVLLIATWMVRGQQASRFYIGGGRGRGGSMVVHDGGAWQGRRRHAES